MHGPWHCRGVGGAVALRLTSLRPLALVCQGLFAAVRSPPGKPSRGFLGGLALIEQAGAVRSPSLRGPWTPNRLANARDISRWSER
jgi:hypothetical protein